MNFGDLALQGIRDIQQYRDAALPGWSRLAMSDVEASSRVWLEGRMRDMGLDVWRDGMGNIFGRLPGTAGCSCAIVLGSHTDTVEGGGRYDGIAGVFAALEVAARLKESGPRLNHDLIVSCFYGEEVNRFGVSCLGSRALVGQLTTNLLLSTNEGGTLGSALAQAGIDPSDAVGAAWSKRDCFAFLELHVEQGSVLEGLGRQIGVVESIAGISRFKALFRGQRDHAGTRPMPERKDAMCSGAEFILAVEKIASRGGEYGVGTCGNVMFSPAASSSITEVAEVYGEVRNVDGPWLSFAAGEIEEAVAAASRTRGVAGELSWIAKGTPTLMTGSVNRVIEDSANDLGYAPVRLHSGAGHDSAFMSRLAPSGMIFIPSVAGRSHCPEELTSDDDIRAGVRVLAEAVVRVDSGGMGS